MSYNQKPPGSSGSGMGGGPPNGPNNIPQVAKTFAGIQQQMQNLVHGQNAIPQSQQADINAFLQQQRIQNMLKQQQQFLQFQHQMQQQQQQHQQQQHQHHNMAGGAGVGPGTVGAVPGVGGVVGPGGAGAAGSGEPLALTRTAGAAELLNKTYQQQANGNPAANPTFNQLQQTLQALPTNFVQHLQAFQYQMQAKQMQQQQHAGGQGQHGHSQQQTVQGVAPPTSTTTSMPHQQQQQQQQQQKHQNQHQQQQQQNALSRYLTVAAVQAAAVSGNKMSPVTPPPPPLTNQMKPPNLPPNTQITPVTASNISSGNTTAGLHSKMPTGNANAGSTKHSAPPPSISLTPSKPATSLPSVAHQQNKFTPPSNAGTKAGHMGHSQNLPKSTHGTTHTATSNTTSPAKTGTNADVTVAASKSPQSTPVQLTKQMPPATSTAAVGNKTLANATPTTAGASSTTVSSPVKPSTAPITAAATNPSATCVSVGSTTTTTSVATANTPLTKSSNNDDGKPIVAEDSTTTKIPPKQTDTEVEATKPILHDGIVKPASNSSEASTDEGIKKDAEKSSEKKTESSDAAAKKPAESPTGTKNSVEKAADDDLNANVAINNSSTKAAPSVSAPLESKDKDEKVQSPVKSNKTDVPDVSENKKNLLDTKKSQEKNKTTTSEEKKSAPLTTPLQESDKKAEPLTTETKIAPSDLSQIKNPQEEKKIESKEKELEKEKDKDNSKSIKSIKSAGKTDPTDNAASKDIQKDDIVVDKQLAEVESKTAQTKTAQNIPNKNLKKHDSNDNKVTETNNKKEISEGEQNKKEDKQPDSAVIETEHTKASKASVLPEKKKDLLPKEKESSIFIPIKTTEKADTIEKAAKTPLLQANKKITEDSIKESIVIAPKESAVVVSTPVKKVGRHAKVAKSKAVSAASSADSKAAETKEEKPTPSSARAKRKPKVDTSLVINSSPSTPKDDDSDRKSTRHRLKTILYQSPLPELAYITKLSASEASNSPKPMSNEDRLIVFYKNEYMAVRNAESTFYLCQTMQNVYRTSPRISIRWLSEDAKDNNVFIPDFYDHTDIECVLTTVELKRIDKGHLRLPKGERNRIESILKKAIDVEKGIVPRPELTEENPDGLDISLFKDESQIEKKSALTEGSESLTPSASARKSKRGAASSACKMIAAALPSTSSGRKRKQDATSSAKSSSSSRKSLTKKRKTLLKRKRKIDHSDGDNDETSDDCESDAEYKPTQKRSSLNVSGTAPRAQRSPLARARAASPITPTTSRSKNVPQNTTPTPSTSKASRGERAAKRKSLAEVGSSEESSTPVKKSTATSNNKVKSTLKRNKH